MTEVLIAGVASFISALVTWIFTRKRQRVDMQTIEIDNLRNIAAEWRQTATEWKSLADEYQQKFIKAMDELEGLRTEVRKLRRALSAAEKKLGTLFDINEEN